MLGTVGSPGYVGVRACNSIAAGDKGPAFLATITAERHGTFGKCASYLPHDALVRGHELPHPAQCGAAICQLSIQLHSTHTVEQATKLRSGTQPDFYQIATV